jgi:hypothetical protein
MFGTDRVLRLATTGKPQRSLDTCPGACYAAVRAGLVTWSQDTTVSVFRPDTGLTFRWKFPEHSFVMNTKYAVIVGTAIELGDRFQPIKYRLSSLPRSKLR